VGVFWFNPQQTFFSSGFMETLELSVICLASSEGQVAALILLMFQFKSQSGWPDWTHFRLLGDCLLSTVLRLKITEVTHTFWQKTRVGLHFWVIFYKHIFGWSFTNTFLGDLLETHFWVIFYKHIFGWSFTNTFLGDLLQTHLVAQVTMLYGINNQIHEILLCQF
jgi:hypothetical protein